MQGEVVVALQQQQQQDEAALPLLQSLVVVAQQHWAPQQQQQQQQAAPALCWQMTIPLPPLPALRLVLDPHLQGQHPALHPALLLLQQPSWQPQCQAVRQQQ